MRTWKRPPVIAVLLAVAVVALAGCTQREAPLFDPNSGTAKFSEAVSPYTRFVRTERERLSDAREDFRRIRAGLERIRIELG